MTESSPISLVCLDLAGIVIDDSVVERAYAEAIATECSEADETARAGRANDELFAPRPSARCGWCDYLRHCPEGAAASTPHRPWDGLDEEATQSGE